VHFEAIWWQLFVCHNVATKLEPNCQLQCAHDFTVLLLRLSNEHALTQLLMIKITSISVRAMTITTVELAGLPAPPTSHTFISTPSTLSLPFPFPNYTAGDLEILPDLS